MEDMLKKALKASSVRSFGSDGGGCINEGHGYEVDGNKVYVKKNHRHEAHVMFIGEEIALNEIHATGTVKVPKPIKVLDNPSGGAVLVMEYLDMKPLTSRAAELGNKLARMHLVNEEHYQYSLKASSSVHKGQPTDDGYVSKFGFDVPTCCGRLPQDNTWQDSWVTFFCRQKLGLQLSMIEKEYKDREARELWSHLIGRAEVFLADDTIRPALLHGDLWAGNVGQTVEEPVMFDAASFYGHHEYDLAIASMFGGFSSEFYEAYHEVIPKKPGFPQRLKLYKLFHYLNHWNHFGTGYRSQSISIMKRLIKQ